MATYATTYGATIMLNQTVTGVWPDPDGGVWIHAERSSSKEEHAAKLQPVTVQALAVSA